MNYSIEDIINECEEMQKFLEEPVSEEPDDLAGRLSLLNVYMARSGNLLAIAKNIQETDRRDAFEKKGSVIADLSPSIASKFIECQTSEANHLVNWLDRINRSCVHQSDNLRTIFSFVKENLKMTRNGY